MEETNLFSEKQRYMGFHGVSTKNLVDHLIEMYSKIRASDLEACRQALAEPIEVDLSIDVYSQRLEDAIQFEKDVKTLCTPAKIV